jgi:hypothetical protein
VGEGIMVEKMFWNVRSLEILDIQEKAIAQAADADVILLSLSTMEASAEVKSWTENWLKLRGQNEGLLVVIPTGKVNQQASELVDYFYETAVSANMDFLCRKKSSRVS